MARVFSTSTVTRALDAAMFGVRAGFPARAFRQELEQRLMTQCGFDDGVRVERRLHRLEPALWEDLRFRVAVSRRRQR